MAFVRTVRVKSSSGQVHEYVKIVENVREQGKARQRVIANLGNKAVLSQEIKKIVNGLLRACGQTQLSCAEDGNLVRVQEYGVHYVAEAVWRKLELDREIKKELKKKRARVQYEEWIRMMVINKLSDPKSKLGIFGWLSGVYWPAHGFSEQLLSEELDEKEHMRLAKREVMKLYRAMDQLLKMKEVLEKHLYLKLRDLFSLEVDLIFYDVTSSYFEGEGPDGLAELGYSRDHEPGNRAEGPNQLLRN